MGQAWRQGTRGSAGGEAGMCTAHMKGAPGYTVNKQASVPRKTGMPNPQTVATTTQHMRNA